MISIVGAIDPFRATISESILRYVSIIRYLINLYKYTGPPRDSISLDF